MELIAQPENEADVQLLIDKYFESTTSEVAMPDQAAASVLQKILQNDNGSVVPLRSNKFGMVPWMRVAAAAVLLIAAMAYWMFTSGHDHHEESKIALAAQKPLPVRHGGNHATLTLADGSRIVLDSIQNGSFQRGTTKINKQNEVLIFDASVARGQASAISYNTLSTPRGGQYRVILPDGSKVWLNASSSLQFPSAFSGSQREVILSGEAYFEVAKNKKMPFHVKVGEMEIRVLGTHFNINAYDNEEVIKTSLLEGSVQIKKGNQTNLLKPGQQGVLNKKENKIAVRNANMDQVMAWKNGFFQFEDADITTIMREIGRWYDVEVIYASAIPVRKFDGKISKESQLSDVLKILELSNVKFTVAGKKIIVQ